jgi:hypothetical protein
MARYFFFVHSDNNATNFVMIEDKSAYIKLNTLRQIRTAEQSDSSSSSHTFIQNVPHKV